MSQSDTSNTVGRAFGRAEADLHRKLDRQVDIVRLIKQIADVQQEADDGAGAHYLIAHGAHNAGFRIAIVVTTLGDIGWSLV